MFRAKDEKQTTIENAPLKVKELFNQKVLDEKQDIKELLSPTSKILVADCESIANAKPTQTLGLDEAKIHASQVSKILLSHTTKVKQEASALREKTLHHSIFKIKSKLIGEYCLKCLDEAKFNDVAHALDGLEEKSARSIMNEWRQSQSPAFRLLFFYYTSLQEWTDAYTLYLGKQLKNPPAGLPKYLIPALKVKHAFCSMFDEKTKNAVLNTLRDKANPVWHVNLDGVRSEGDVSFDRVHLPNANLNHAVLSNVNFANASLPHASFYSSRLSGNFENVDLSSVNLDGILTYFKVTDYLVTSSLKDCLKGISDDAIKLYYEKNKHRLLPACSHWVRYIESIEKSEKSLLSFFTDRHSLRQSYLIGIMLLQFSDRYSVSHENQMSSGYGFGKLLSARFYMDAIFGRNGKASLVFDHIYHSICEQLSSQRAVTIKP
jgi:hypothetical protein